MVHLVVEQKASLLSCKKKQNIQMRILFVTLAATFSLSVRACVCVHADVKLVFREWPLVHRGGKKREHQKHVGLREPKKNEPLI